MLNVSAEILKNLLMAIFHKTKRFCFYATGECLIQVWNDINDDWISFLSFFLSNYPFRVYSPLAMSCLQLRETFFFYHGRKCVFDVSLLICFCGNIQSKIYVCVCVSVCDLSVYQLWFSRSVCVQNTSTPAWCRWVFPRLISSHAHPLHWSLDYLILIGQKFIWVFFLFFI